MLLEEANLKAIISLPQGIFVSKNGQGPKTSILVFEKGRKTDWTWFYKVTNDGYSMGTNRKEQKGNQLIECLNLWHEYVKHDKQPPESKNQFCIPSQWIKTLDPRVKEKIRIDTRKELEEKGAIEKSKKHDDWDKKIEAKKATEDEKQMDLKLFDQMLENRIQNEIAKRIDKAHNYSFNLANYKSTLSESQFLEWSQALSHIQPVEEKTLDEVYKKLCNSKPENILAYIARLNPAYALEADIAREYLNGIDEIVIAKQNELNIINEVLKSKIKYPVEKLESKIIPKYEKIKKDNYDGEIDIVDKISFKDGKIHFRDINETGMDLYKAQKGDLVTSKINVHQGALALADRNLVCSTHYQVYEIDKAQINPDYLVCILRSKQFQARVNDIKNKGIKNEQGAEFLLSLEIPTPPIEDQMVIANDILRLNSVIDSTEKIIENWTIDFESYIENYKVTQQPISELILDSLYGTSSKSDYQEEGFNVLRIGNIGFCNFKLEDIKKTVLSEKEYKKYELIKGDFLIVRSNGNPNLVGKCAVWECEIPFVYASYLIRFRFNHDIILPKYVMYFLMSSVGRALLKPTAGGGTYNISATEFQKIQIQYPDLDIQKEIIDKIDKKINTLNELVEMKNDAIKQTNKILDDVWGIYSEASAIEGGAEDGQEDQ